MISPQAIIATVRLNLMRRPLMSSEAAEELLDVNRAQLNALVDCGKLAWCWDVSARRQRIELRILTASVVEFATGSLLPAIGATRNLGFANILPLVLPHVRPLIRGVELQRLFACSADAVRDLYSAGELVRIHENLPATGVNASSRYTRESVARFLERRRLT